MNYSPLRYPGGKLKLAPFVTDLVIQNGIQGGCYIEPFAGGSNIALHLLFSEYVNEICLNDIDRSVFCFWDAILHDTDAIIKCIRDTAITIEEWEKQKEIQRNKEKADPLELAFSTFFLNRTNRSGIINSGGVIGGKEQNGVWKIDARYNIPELIRRIEKIALFSSRITLTRMDAADYLLNSEKLKLEKAFVYLDPPYYMKGSKLYANFYSEKDHELLSELIHKLTVKWMLTYDYEPEILNLYGDINNRVLTLSYSAAQKKQGIEFIGFSSGLIIPDKDYASIRIA